MTSSISSAVPAPATPSGRQQTAPTDFSQFYEFLKEGGHITGRSEHVLQAVSAFVRTKLAHVRAEALSARGREGKLAASPSVGSFQGLEVLEVAGVPAVFLYAAAADFFAREKLLAGEKVAGPRGGVGAAEQHQRTHRAVFTAIWCARAQLSPAEVLAAAAVRAGDESPLARATAAAASDGRGDIVVRDEVLGRGAVLLHKEKLRIFSSRLDKPVLLRDAPQNVRCYFEGTQMKLVLERARACADWLVSNFAAGELMAENFFADELADEYEMADELVGAEAEEYFKILMRAQDGGKGRRCENGR